METLRAFKYTQMTFITIIVLNFHVKKNPNEKQKKKITSLQIYVG